MNHHRFTQIAFNVSVKKGAFAEAGLGNFVSFTSLLY